MSDMTLAEELEWRGLIKDHTFEDINWLNTPRKFYLGSDGSSNSLTIGNLAIYMLARRLIVSGWDAVLLFGGATTLIGDPGGKDEERELKPRDEVEQNVLSIERQVKKLFKGYSDSFTVVNNYDWFFEINYIEFLRDVGKYYSMTELIQRDYIANRIGEGNEGISYAEFSYNLIQGYDFYHLFKKGVELQIGGSDQWGNMLSGVPLIRKKLNKEAHALSMPLVINKLTGKKFGKSEEGAIWLDPKKSSVTRFYQFWINSDDEGVEDYLKIYTMLSKQEIDELIEQHKNNPKERKAQWHLAEEVTKLVHGEEATGVARVVTNVLRGLTGIGDVGDKALDDMRRELPTLHASIGMEIIEALAQTGLAASKSEARRLLQGNAIFINGQKTQKEHLEEGDFQNGRLLIRKGKAFKDSALVELA
jgi:tyrosyl-tRNA synthetase